MELPLSFLAYQVLALAAGLALYALVRSCTPRVATGALRRTVLEGAVLAAGGVLLVVAGRLAMPRFGSSALFLPVGMVFYAVFFWAAGTWLLRGLRARSPSTTLIALGLLGLAVEMLFLEPERLEVTRLQIGALGAEDGRRALRIVHLTDLQTVGPCRREREAWRAIEDFHPDLILMTGDYGTGGEDALLHARQLLEKLDAPGGIFAVIGDAENRAEMARMMEGLDIHWLDNQGMSVEIAGSELFIAGVDRLAPDPRRALRGRPEGVATLLLAHAPDAVLALEAAGLEVDLVLSGHTHGGQICLPGLGPPLTLSRLPRRFASGLHEREGSVHQLLVGRGLGMEARFSPRMRLFCPPQITLIEFGAAASPASE